MRTAATPEKPIFDKYSAYYDLVYQDKDYSGEAEFVHRNLLSHGKGRPGRILELGCGTARHAVELAKLGWSIRAYDLSPGMIDRAGLYLRSLPDELRAKVSLEVGDITKIREEVKFDVVISLFHVLCYQTTNAGLQSALQTAAHHLERGGLFLFDFWYGGAVLQVGPSVRIKKFANESHIITRVAEPIIHHEENTVMVNYEIFVENLLNQQTEKMKNPMRFAISFSRN